MKNKIILIFLIAIVIVFALYTISNAAEENGNDIDAIIDSMSGANESGEMGKDNKIVKGVNVIYTLIRAVGTGIALLMVIVLGIKYMMASVEEKAEIKKQAVPILIGSGFVFATSQMLSAVLKIVNE